MVASFGCFFNSCNREEVNITLENEESTNIISVKQSTQLNNEVLSKKLLSSLSQLNFSSEISRGVSNTYEYDIDNAIITEYENTDIKSISVPLSAEVSYITYSKEDMLMEGGMLLKVVQTGNVSTVEYLSLENEYLGKVVVVDGVITESEGVIENGKWINTFGQCVGYNLNWMSSGSVSGSATALVCIAFGPECAAALAIACAVGATFG